MRACPNLRALRLNGVTAAADESVALALGSHRPLRYLDLSNAGLTDSFLSVFGKSASESGQALGKLSISNSPAITDGGIKHLATVSNSLSDLCIAGNFKITDSGIFTLVFSSMTRFNSCGAYKITDSSRRYILGQNPQILIYNSFQQFGDGRRGGFWDDLDDWEGLANNGSGDYESFRRRMQTGAGI